MGAESILSAITTVGFPIAMCLVLMWQMNDVNEKHKEETEKFTEALNSNTLVLQKLCDKMDIEREGE